MTKRPASTTDSGEVARFATAPSDLFSAVFARAHRCWRRWDEGLWRYLELTAVAGLFRERALLLQGPVLDLGCGDGEVFEWLFGRRPDAFGIDSCATRGDDLSRARESGRYADVRQEDAARLTFEDESFGLVFSNSVLEHIEPVGPVLAEAYRVLRPGGHLVFTTPDPDLYSKGCYYWRGALSRVGLDRLGRALVSRECSAYRHVSVLTFDDWKREGLRVGFADLERRAYVSAAAARAITRFGALTRVPGLERFAWLVSHEARALSRSPPEAAGRWIERCREVLKPLLDAPEATAGCGQLILARRPGRSSEARDAASRE